MKTRLYIFGIAVLFFLFTGCGEQSLFPSFHDASSVRKTVTEIIAQQLGIPSTKVTPESRLITDLGADELDIVELIMTIEETYGFEISDAAFEKKLAGQPPTPKWNLSVQDIIELAERK